MPQQVAPTPLPSAQANFMAKVYAYMAGGLGLTGLTAFLVASSPTAINLFLGNRAVFYGLLLVELLMVWAFTGMARTLSAANAAIVFYCYSVVSGITMSVIFLVYTHGSIASTFVITGGAFGLLSLYGFLTKKDLGPVGAFCGMALFGLIMAMIVNLFVRSMTLSWLTTFVGILVFAGLTAYDTQKVKSLADDYADAETTHKRAIHGALVLYLDFINMFLFLLRLFGRRR